MKIERDSSNQLVLKLTPDEEQLLRRCLNLVADEYEGTGENSDLLEFAENLRLHIRGPQPKSAS